MAHTAVDAVRRPGRPRLDDIDQRVIDAAVDLLISRGVDGPPTITAIVNRSGVSRAALYRRWANREELLAVALDSVRKDVVVPDTGDLLADIVAAYTLGPGDTPRGFDALVRTRLVLALEDQGLQRAYWNAHVSRRRVPVADALQRGISSGLLRPDIDIDATIDLIAGAYYYQLVVRGEDTAGPSAQHRVHTAIRMLWRGLLASTGAGEASEPC